MVGSTAGQTKSLKRVLNAGSGLVGLARAMTFDFTQSRIAARFRGHGHAIDALNLVDLQGKGLGHDGIHGDTGRSAARAKKSKMPNLRRLLRPKK
jgi:hypothetical protein